MFTPSVIEDHATTPIERFRLTTEDPFGGSASLDVFTRSHGGRVAKRQITSAPTAGAEERLKKRTVKPFWQLAPDAETIERAYDPEEEPIIV